MANLFLIGKYFERGHRFEKERENVSAAKDVEFPLLHEIFDPCNDLVVLFGNVGDIKSFSGIAGNHIFSYRDEEKVPHRRTDPEGDGDKGTESFEEILTKTDVTHIFEYGIEIEGDDNAIDDKRLTELIRELNMVKKKSGAEKEIVWHRMQRDSEEIKERSYERRIKRLGFRGKYGIPLTLYRKRTGKSSEEEYKMVREQILNYMDKYQTVRNMMYLITVTILGFAAGNGMDQIQYLFLVPLIVILPSALLHQDYHKGVVRAGAYLQVFHEGRDDSNHHWETRTRATRVLGKKRFVLIELLKKAFWRNNGQDLCYIACTVACLGLYAVPIKRIYCETGIIPFCPTFIGVAALVVSFGVFYTPQKADSDKFLMDFDKIENLN